MTQAFVYNGGFDLRFLRSDEKVTSAGDNSGDCIVTSPRGDTRIVLGHLYARHEGSVVDLGSLSERSIAWEPNATEFTISRWFLGEDKAPTFVVTWDNSWGEEDENGNETPESGEERFSSLDEAFVFCRGLLAANDFANIAGAQA